MKFIYRFSIFLMVWGLRFLSLFNHKARLGIQGRKQSLNIAKKLSGERVIWMHAASLGEYEQGFPVLEKLKEKFPKHKILITFFSPSGYENVIKKNHIADEICYLPFDREREIRAFVSQFQTDIFFTIKYDFWYNLLEELKKEGTKTFVVSALFYEKQAFFKPYGSWFVKQLKENIDWFFHQTGHSEKLAKSIGLTKSSVSGDTRFDRVKQLREGDNFVEFIKEFKSDKKLIVFGSSWEAEEGIANFLAKNADAKIIIAPHDIHRNLEFEVPYLKFSEVFKNSQLLNSKVKILIIDSIGLLSKLYAYADIAVVGGGFHSAGLHNILEAATFGKPVIFGNHYKKNPEADALILNNGGRAFGEENEAIEFISNLLNDEELLAQMSKNAENFVDAQPNATEIIIRKILGNY